VEIQCRLRSGGIPLACESRELEPRNGRARFALEGRLAARFLQFHTSVDLLDVDIDPHGALHAAGGRCCRCSGIHIPESQRVEARLAWRLYLPTVILISIMLIFIAVFEGH
jgi:hypothetical protein